MIVLFNNNLIKNIVLLKQCSLNKKKYSSPIKNITFFYILLQNVFNVINKVKYYIWNKYNL